MGLVTLLRGFKVPIAVLDCFLAAHGVQETEHIPPHLFPPHLFRGGGGTSASTPQLDPQSAFFRARLAASNPDPASLEAVRLFIPHRRGQDRSAYGYVAYTFIMVFGQRYVDLVVELPEQAPPGFAALRREVLGFAAEGEQALLQVAGMRGPGAESAFFVVLTEQREFPLERPFVRESDLRCEQCAAEFETWSALHVHRSELHGVDIMSNPLPDDLWVRSVVAVWFWGRCQGTSGRVWVYSTVFLILGNKTKFTPNPIYPPLLNSATREQIVELAGNRCCVTGRAQHPRNRLVTDTAVTGYVRRVRVAARCRGISLLEDRQYSPQRRKTVAMHRAGAPLVELNPELLPLYNNLSVLCPHDDAGAAAWKHLVAAWANADIIVVSTKPRSFERMSPLQAEDRAHLGCFLGAILSPRGKQLRALSLDLRGFALPSDPTRLADYSEYHQLDSLIPRLQNMPRIRHLTLHYVGWQGQHMEELCGKLGERLVSLSLKYVRLQGRGWADSLDLLRKSFAVAPSFLSGWGRSQAIFWVIDGGEIDERIPVNQRKLLRSSMEEKVQDYVCGFTEHSPLRNPNLELQPARRSPWSLFF